MGDIKGFMKIERELPSSQEPTNRLKHYKEFYNEFTEKKKIEQASRCMDCGIPFCHSGCPLGNVIPDFNDAVYKENWQEAYDILSLTNNFPEFTGRICPAPCESACVLGINENPVAIELIEKSIIEKAFENGWVTPNKKQASTSKKVAVIGSGPAGLACADQLNKAGHDVTVYERADRLGGLLRYGIPDFKLEKWVVDRRIDLMKKSGVKFQVSTNVGKDISVAELKDQYDAISLCGGSTIPRDLKIEGRDLTGIYPAMDFLTQSNQKIAGDTFSAEDLIDANGKDVLVIGGGDTGSDCIGTSNRQGATSVTQIEIMSKPPTGRNEDNPWPNWPMILRTSSSHEEGCNREWSVLTKRFISEDGVSLSGLEVAEVTWEKDESGKFSMVEKEGSTRIIPCQLVFLAIGFLHPQKEGLLTQLGVDLDNRGNIQTTDYKSSQDGVFAAGDMRRGQSLVVWAISEGRESAIKIDEYLTGQPSQLSTKQSSVLAI